MSAALGLMALPAEAAGVQPSQLAVRLAATTKIGPVAGLTATATKPGTAYTVSASWKVLTGATSYAVSMVYAGTVVASGKVPQPTSTTDGLVKWTAQTTLPAMTSLTVKVVPVASKRRGVAATTSLVLPDLTAPDGQYTLVLDHTVATVTQDALSDDVTPTDQITRAIDWGAGNGFENWTTGTTVSNDYKTTGLWKPQVRLTDLAGNTRTIALKTVVIGDTTAPVGSYTAAPQQAWAKLTRVVLTQVSLSDDFSSAADVVRVVDWKDGTAATPWTSGTTLSHVYQVGGTFTPSVTLVDEAGNQTTVDSSPVTVAVDTTAPVVRVNVPRWKASHVSSWKTVHGIARDGAGTGVKRVVVRVVEKRGTSWYAYRAPSKTWVRAGSTKASAMRLTRAAVASWSAGRWSTPVARLRKGTIVVTARASDRVGNTSAPVSVSKRLTSW